MPQANNIHAFLKNLQGNLLATPIGDFKIGSQLGQGGNGLVVSATHGINEFAIKFLTNSNSQKFSRFVDEYLGTSTLPPNPLIVRPIQFGIHTDGLIQYPYIIMNKYDGVLEKTNSPIDSIFLKNVIDNILDGLDFLHSNGVIHRDIKPQNIFKTKDKYIIGDLGIASFDPEAYARHAKTEKGDRLANFSFSAPEQVNSIAAHATMDIYAFGQIIQWLSNGEVHKGTNRKRISVKIDEYNQLDKTIDACLSNDPSQRPQTITILRSLLKNNKLKNDPIQNGYQKWDALHSFNNVISKSFPKNLSALITENKNEINRFMINLKTVVDSAQLWWESSTGGNMKIDNIENSNIEENTWLIDDWEFKIDELMIYRDNSIFSNFAILITKGSTPFFSASNYSEDQASYWKSTYISNAEAENGYMEIDDEVIELNNPKPSFRRRFLNTQALLLAPNASSALQMQSDADVSQLLHTITSNLQLFDVHKLKQHATKFRRNVDPDVHMLM